MSGRIHWCPFCDERLYKSQGNLTNHIEEKHEPQKHHRCLDCGRSWNTKLGRTRHVSKTNCSGQHFETTHHSDKKSLYSCGICEAVFDDFGLRQEHLLNHQQRGKSKADWTKDTMMRGLLTHASVANTWNVFVIQNIPHLDTQNLSWNWSDGRVINAMEALECKRFGSNQQLRNILSNVLASLNDANEPEIDVNSDAAFMQELQLFSQVPLTDLDVDLDFGVQFSDLPA